MKERYLVITLLLVFTVPLKAQEIQSLVFSGGKNFVGKDVIQVEYGLNFERQKKSISRTSQQISQYALAKYGLNNQLDLSISYNFARVQTFVSDQVRRSNGLTNLTVGLKKKLAKNYSLQSNFGFSNDGSDGLQGGAQIFGISEHNIDSFLAWENNLGIIWARGQPQANLMYLSGLTFTIPYPFDIILEVYGQYGRDLWDNYANIGLGYYFNADLMLEAYAGYGNTSDQPNSCFSLNFYWRLVPARYYED
jgi:hypothetical protein